MTKQIYYEDVEPAGEVPSLINHPTPSQLVKWAGAVDDYYPIHFDKNFAQEAGYPEVFAHGWLTSSFLIQMLTDWAGDLGNLKKLKCRFHVNIFPNQDVTGKGKVVKKYIDNNEGCVECDIWLENAKGEKAITGSAVVAFPMKG